LDGKKEFNLTTGGIREGQGKSPFFSLTFLIMDVLRWRRWHEMPEVEIVGIAPRAIRIGKFGK